MKTPNPLRKYRAEKAQEILEKLWKENIRTNLREGKNVKTRSLANLHFHKPAVVVGAGPSLDKNSELLTKLKLDTVVVCCDKVSGKIPITSTYVVALNSQETDVVDWIAPARKKSTLIVPFTVWPKTYSEWESDIIWVNLDLPVVETNELKMAGYPPLVGGSNAGVFSYLVAVEMGCTPIVLVGMDYSFLTREEVMANQGKRYLIWEGTDINGDVRYGSWDWYDSYVAFCEYVASAQQYRGVITINATEGGFLYDNQHIAAMPLRSVLKDGYV